MSDVAGPNYQGDGKGFRHLRCDCTLGISDFSDDIEVFLQITIPINGFFRWYRSFPTNYLSQQRIFPTSSDFSDHLPFITTNFSDVIGFFRQFTVPSIGFFRRYRNFPSLSTYFSIPIVNNFRWYRDFPTNFRQFSVLEIELFQRCTFPLAVFSLLFLGFFRWEFFCLRL
jgi:hypothetical protein